jgi:hypothetical protein
MTDGSHELLLAINGQLSTLIGKVGGLEAQMDESIRQRRTQFVRLDNLDGRVTELITTVHAHAEGEERIFSQFRTDLEQLDVRVDQAEDTLIRLERPPCATAALGEASGPQGPTSGRKVVLFGGGTSLLAVVFGDDVISGMTKFAEGAAKIWHKLH